MIIIVSQQIGDNLFKNHCSN